MSVVVARFENLCGANVILRRGGEGISEWHDWLCEGCGEGASASAGFKKHRDAANEHASTCRAKKR